MLFQTKMEIKAKWDLSQPKGTYGDVTIKGNMGSWITFWDRKGQKAKLKEPE